MFLIFNYCKNTDFKVQLILEGAKDCRLTLFQTGINLIIFSLASSFQMSRIDQDNHVCIGELRTN